MQHTVTAKVRRTLLASALIYGGAVAIAPAVAGAQWVRMHETFYLQAPHNWTFRDNYPHADRLFNAFDFGHAILYETLWAEPNAPVSALEVKRYNQLTRHVLVRPPRVPLEEAAIEIKYAQLAPEAKVMFDWAHILHRQIYDVLADESLSEERKDAEVQRLIAYYKTRRDVAFSSKPKSMELMQEQPYSLAFRKQYPKFNGLIWAYHWLQVGLYEPLLTGRTLDERQLNVRATVARFWQMLQDPPRTFPYQMPMTAAVAPTFAARYPEAAIIFDNLHSMHDVISDILANDSVPRNRKRAEIMIAAQRYRDDTSFVMPVPAWLTMAREMGVENMGGRATNFLPALPTPTVTYGAVMQHDEQTGRMTGIAYGSATGAHGAHGAMAGMSNATPNVAQGAPARDTSMAGMDHSTMKMGDSTSTARQSVGQVDHAAMGHGARGSMGAMAEDTSTSMDDMMRLHAMMMRDPAIRARVMADTAMRRLMSGMMDEMEMTKPASSATGRASPAPARGTRPRAATAPRQAPRARTVKPPASADPHAGHNMTAPATPAPKKAAAPARPRPVKRDSTPAADPHKGHTPPARR